jgi:hypothetical protein
MIGIVCDDRNAPAPARALIASPDCTSSAFSETRVHSRLDSQHRLSIHYYRSGYLAMLRLGAGLIIAPRALMIGTLGLPPSLMPNWIASIRPALSWCLCRASDHCHQTAGHDCIPPGPTYRTV